VSDAALRVASKHAPLGVLALKVVKARQSSNDSIVRRSMVISELLLRACPPDERVLI